MKYSFVLTYEDRCVKRSSVLYRADNVFDALKFALDFFIPERIHDEDNDDLASFKIHGALRSIEVFANSLSVDSDNLPCVRSVSCGILTNEKNFF